MNSNIIAFIEIQEPVVDGPDQKLPRQTGSMVAHHDDIVTRMKNVEMIEIGKHRIRPWYFSPYPQVCRYHSMTCCCLLGNLAYDISFLLYSILILHTLFVAHNRQNACFNAVSILLSCEADSEMFGFCAAVCCNYLVLVPLTDPLSFHLST